MTSNQKIAEAMQTLESMLVDDPAKQARWALGIALDCMRMQSRAHETDGCHIRPHDFCSAGTCAVCIDAARYRFLRDTDSYWSSLFAESKFEAGQWVRLGTRFIREELDRRIDVLRAQKTDAVPK